MSNILVDQLVFPFILRFFFVFGLISLAVGIGMLFKPEPMQRLFDVMNRWISTRRSMRWLEIPRDEEAPLHRFRRSVGAVALPILAYSTFILITQGDMKSFVDALRLGTGSSAFLVLILMETARWFLIVFGVAAIAAIVMLIFFPDALKSIEKLANRWISAHNLLRGGDDMHMGLDTWIRAHPRAMGSLIAMAALAVTVNFGIMLRA